MTSPSERQELKKQMWGTNSCAQGWGVIGFIWIYEPIVRFLQADPWSLQTYGLALLGLGILINCIQWAIES